MILRVCIENTSLLIGEISVQYMPWVWFISLIRSLEARPSASDPSQVANKVQYLMGEQDLVLLCASRINNTNLHLNGKHRPLHEKYTLKAAVLSWAITVRKCCFIIQSKSLCTES